MKARLARLGLKVTAVVLALILVVCFFAAADDGGIDGADVIVLLLIGLAAVYAYMKADAMPRVNHREESDRGR